MGLCGGGIQRSGALCLAGVRGYGIRMVALPVLSLGLAVAVM